MNNDLFEQEMRKYELYHSIRVMDNLYSVIRVDGRSFSALTEKHFSKPFDIDMHNIMIDVSKTLLVELGGIYAYTESDEISILLNDDFNLFDREVEKLVSVSAGIASAKFSMISGILGHFDSRIWVGTSPSKVTDYFRWRQSDAERCSLNGLTYWTLRSNGLSQGRATSALNKKTIEEKLQILTENSISFHGIPSWQKYGTGMYWEHYVKDGFNPLTNKTVKVMRRQIKTDEQLPTKNEYSKLILDVLGQSSNDSVTIGIS
jgi:tRNA(His) 5'-end guanylyltransferase